MSDSNGIDSSTLLLQDDDSTTTVAIAVAVVVVLVTTLFVYFKKYRHPVALTQEFQAFPLVRKEILTHDTRRFTFGLPSPNHQFGLPVGQHATLMFQDDNNKRHQRSYTPVSQKLGEVSFCIKVYFAGVNQKFPNGGKVSQHLDALEIGDSMQIKGPKGHLWWKGKGWFELKLPRKPLQVRHVTELNMIAGGTGITPMLQILHAIFLDNDSPKVSVKLLYANQTEDDILVRDKLESLAREYPDRFQLWYTVDKAPKDWKYSEGFITKEMIADHLYGEPNKGIQVFMCGPPPMIKFACLPNLQALGFTENDWHVF